MTGDVKVAFGEALADALTLAGSHATHPTEIVIDPYFSKNFSATVLKQDTATEFKNSIMSFAHFSATLLGIPIPQTLERTNLTIFRFGSHFIFAAAAHSRISVSF